MTADRTTPNPQPPPKLTINRRTATPDDFYAVMSTDTFPLKILDINEKTTHIPYARARINRREADPDKRTTTHYEIQIYFHATAQHLQHTIVLLNAPTPQDAIDTAIDEATQHLSDINIMTWETP